MNNLIIKNSIKQSKIVEILAKTRGGNAEQIARALYQKSTPSELTKTYELLKKLELKALIDYFVYKDDSVQKRFYFLSRKGLSLFQDFFNIEEDTKGSGLFGDFSYFKHSIYMPKSNQMKHLLMCVDAMIDVYILMSNYPNSEIDFAHNLYAANGHVKADFIIIKSKQIYFVEIDRMHERGVALTNKFERYNKYFNTKNEVSLPQSIYFVVPSSKREKKDHFDSSHERRFQSVANAFLKECSNYVQKVDLCLVSVANFINVLREDLLPPKVNTEIIEYLTNKYAKHFNLSWNKNKIYFVVKDNITHYIITEIQWLRTKIWYDLNNLQKCYSKVTSTEVGLLKFESDVIHHMPKVQILTNKKNLEDLLNPKKFPTLANLYNKKQVQFIRNV